MKKLILSIPNPANKPVVITKQIHSSMSSVSSNDVLLYMATTKEKLDFPLVKGARFLTSRYPTLNGEEIASFTENVFALVITCKDDKSYYNTRGMGANKEQMEAKAKFYTDKGGWHPKRPAILTKMYAHEDYIRKQKRALDGFVIPEWHTALTPLDYLGGLSMELFSHPYIHKYLKDGGVHGYIGSSNRTFAIDREFERLAEHGFSPDEIAVFVTSTTGRHYADQLDEVADVARHFDGYFPPSAEWFDSEVKVAQAMVLEVAKE